MAGSGSSRGLDAFRPAGGSVGLAEGALLSWSASPSDSRSFAVHQSPSVSRFLRVPSRIVAVPVGLCLRGCLSRRVYCRRAVAATRSSCPQRLPGPSGLLVRITFGFSPSLWCLLLLASPVSLLLSVAASVSFLAATALAASSPSDCLPWAAFFEVAHVHSLPLRPSSSPGAAPASSSCVSASSLALSFSPTIPRHRALTSPESSRLNSPPRPDPCASAASVPFRLRVSAPRFRARDPPASVHRDLLCHLRRTQLPAQPSVWSDLPPRLPPPTPPRLISALRDAPSPRTGRRVTPPWHSRWPVVACVTPGPRSACRARVDLHDVASAPTVDPNI